MNRVKSVQERQPGPNSPLKKGEIRLLSLTQSQQANTIECTRKVVTLTESPPYHALSYVWGEDNEKCSIICDGIDTLVNKNLYDFLLHIQDSRKRQSRYAGQFAGRVRGESNSSQELTHGECGHQNWWIDVLSIRQDDIQERNAQVALMGDIFRQASCVVVWLKQEASTLQQAIEYVKEDKKNLTLHSTTSDWSDHRSWFHRMWTLQEYVLAQQTVFCHGTDRLGRSDMIRYQRMLADDGHSDFSWQGVSVIANLHGLPKSRALSEILAYASRRIALDDRDRLFALLSLLPDRDLYGLEADYGSSISDVCKMVTRAIITREKNLRLFDSGGLQNQLNRDIPSWAYDLRPGLCIQPDEMNEQYFTQPVMGPINGDGELQLRGRVVGAFESFDRTEQSPKAGVILDSVLLPPSKLAGGTDISYQYGKQLEELHDQVFSQAQKSSLGSRLYLATLPIFSVEIGFEQQEPGDLICMLLGGKRLYCLRPVGEILESSGSEMDDESNTKPKPQGSSYNKTDETGSAEHMQSPESPAKEAGPEARAMQDAEEDTKQALPGRYQLIGILQIMKSPELEQAIGDALNSALKDPNFEWEDFVLV